MTDENMLKYHYCRQEGLLKILDTRTMWATHIRYLNDGSELKYTFDLVQEILPRLIRSQVDDSLAAYVQQEITGFLKDREKHHRFVISFSEHENDLTMWRAYGRDGGYSIGIDIERLKDNRSLSIQHSHLVRCEYERQEQVKEVEEVLGELIECILKATVRDYRNEPQSRLQNLDDPAKINILTSKLADFATRFKDISFRHEQEWRIVSSWSVTDETTEKGKKVQKIKYRSGRYCPIPYVEFKLNDEKPVDKIWIGPNPFQDLAYDAIHSMYAAFSNLPARPRAPVIRKSKIPFRPTW